MVKVSSPTSLSAHDSYNDISFNSSAHSGGRNLRKGDGAGKQPFSSDSLNKTFIKSARAILSNKKQNSKGQGELGLINRDSAFFSIHLPV